MDTTFITIHDLTVDARILYVSNSIADILGHRPEEVIGRSCWEYFHPDEIPFAQAIHGRGVQLDKAAVLNYCQIKNKDGGYIGCECVFTVVHDVLVGCTSVYQYDEKSQKRAADAPIIRQLFSSSPRDPRYHMLSYISSKFSSGPRPSLHEARAAIFLNRFTRTLTIMYATNGLEALLGIPATELQGKSFYYCIQENCLPEAVRCLESAKANDSIAYLRFWFRDPRDQPAGDEDENMSDAQSSDQDDDEGGGVRLGGDAMDTDSGDQMVNSASSNSGSVNRHRPSPSSSATNGSNTSPAAIFDQPYPAPESSTTSVFRTDRSPLARRTAAAGPLRQVELEAVVSCTSDGLVVILRKARPFVLDTLRPPVYQNGLFAAPWGTRPIIPDTPSPLSIPIDAQGYPAPINAPGAPSEDFMNSIREVAVFAWALTGINGSLAQYSRGNPQPGAQPYSGLPIWAPGVDEPDGAVANGSSYVHCKDPKKVEL